MFAGLLPATQLLAPGLDGLAMRTEMILTQVLRHLTGFPFAASTPGVHKMVLRELLMPRQWKPPEDRKFVLDAEQINELCETAERILREEPSVLRLTGAPPAPTNLGLGDELRSLEHGRSSCAAIFSRS